MKMGATDKLVYLLLVVGGLNWGLVGFFKYNLVDKIFGVESFMSRLIYVVVGLAAVNGVYTILSMISKMDKKK